MIAFAVAVIVNYPKPDDQMEQVRSYAVGMITVVSIIFAAGIFTGILSGTGMITEMATSLVYIISTSSGGFMAIIVAIHWNAFKLIIHARCILLWCLADY